MRLRLITKLFVAIAVLMIPQCDVVIAQYVPDSVLEAKILQCQKSLLADDFSMYLAEFEGLAERNDNHKFKIDAAGLHLFRHYSMGQTDSLKFAVDKAKAICLKYGDSRKYYYCWSFLIHHYIMSGKTETAYLEIHKMRNEAENEKFPYGIAMSISSTGDAYMYLEIYEKAIENYFVAAQQFRQNKEDLIRVCDIYYFTNIANHSLGKFEDMLIIANEMDSVINLISPDLTHSGLMPYRMVNYCSKVIAYANVNNFDMARVSLDSAQSYYIKCEKQPECMLEAQSVYFTQIGEYAKADKMYDSVIRFIDCLGLDKEKLRFLRNKAINYAKMGEYKRAYATLYGYTVSKDSLVSATTYSHLNELAIINEVSAIKLEKENLEIKISRSTVYWLILISAILVVVVAVIVRFYLREHKLNQKLSISQAELESEKQALISSEVQLTEALHKANQADKLKTKFLANMSHEIRTPLNSIVGFSELMVDCDSVSERESYRDIITDNNNMLLKLISDMVDLSKIESGIIYFHNEWFDSSQLFHDITSDFTQRLRFSDSNVEFCFEQPKESLWLYTDKQILGQVVMNFLTNAMKFTKKGEIKLSYEYVERGVKITVTDTGIGVSSEMLPKIFERFCKVDDFTQGAGLGLPIAKAIVEANGGKIGADSEIGVGSAFWAWFPCEASSERRV